MNLQFLDHFCSFWTLGRINIHITEKSIYFEKGPALILNAKHYRKVRPKHLGTDTYQLTWHRLPCSHIRDKGERWMLVTSATVNRCEDPHLADLMTAHMLLKRNVPLHFTLSSQKMVDVSLKSLRSANEDNLFL